MQKLMLIATLLGTALVAACASSPTTRFYTLGSGKPLGPISATPYRIAIGMVTVPDAVDRPQIVTRISNNQLHINDFSRWAEPLKFEIPRVIAANLARETDCGIATLCEPLDTVESFLDPNIVKLVRDDRMRAMYFSRAPIPWPRDDFARDRSRLPEGFLPLRHIGIYAYRVSFLHRFVGWPLGVLEARECLEQLRALEHGVGIHVAQACAAIPGGVDTAADLARVNALLAAAP